MPSDSRRDLATATVGASGLAAGGVGRHVAVERLKNGGRKPGFNHSLTILRHGTKGQKRLFFGSSALGLAAAPALAVGTTRLATGEDVKKKDDARRSFWAEGLRGSAGALKGRGESALEPVPKGIRATQLGVAAGAGFGGSALTRGLMRGSTARVKPLVAPVAGVLAATASVPGTNKLVQRKNPNYEVTAYGVRRKKDVAVKPSRKSFEHRATPRSFREDVGKADSYLGSRTNYAAQRAAITVAGHPPIVGPITQAAAAGSYAPPGQEKKQALRQYGMASAAPVGVGIAGAYGGAALADRSPGFARRAENGLKRLDRVEGAVRSKVGLKPKVPLMDKPATSFAGRNRDKFLGSRPGKKLLGKNPARWGVRGVGATAGFLGAKMTAGAIGGQAAISLNQRDQDKYNLKNGIVRKADVAPQTKRERSNLAEKKRLSAVLSAVGGTAGLAGVGLLAAGKKGPATTAGIIGGGFGGTNALLNVPIQRKEAKAIDPIKKAENVAKAMARLPWDGPRHVIHRGTKARVLEYHGNGKMTVLGAGDQRFLVHRDQVAFPKTKKTPKPQGPEQLSLFDKRDSLEIKYKAEHPTLLRQYGDKGPLPKGLDRETKMKAYEARYVAHGGDKADKYGRRAERAEQTRNVGLAAATAAGAGHLLTRGPKRAARTVPKAVRRHAETAAVAGGTLAGGAELYGEFARNRRASYTNSPAGVAGSALRRMRDYTPD